MQQQPDQTRAATAMPARERQRRYRDARLARGDVRLTIIIDMKTRRTLGRLARWHGVTLQQALALAVERTDAALTDSLPAPQRLAYRGGARDVTG